MNAERVEIARRLVACKGWVWLPGMQYMDPTGEVCVTDRVHHVEILRSAWGVDEPFIFSSDDTLDFICARVVVPDLDDDLTRAGVLAVVRRAWKCRAWTAPYVQWSPEGNLDWCMVEIPVAPTYDAGRARFNGPTEEAALLAALEAASR